MITDIFLKAPLWVWPLLAFILISGIKASKNHILSVKKLMLIPLAFFIWALYSIFAHTDMYELSLLIASLAVGATLGYLLVRNLNVRFDKAKQIAEMPGSWMTLILALSIFALKFSLGAIISVNPTLKGTLFLLIIEVAAAIIAGIFAGRGISYWLKYKAAP